MNTVIRLEQKIAGSQLVWITISVLVCFLVLCATGGDLVNWTYLGFEIIMPLCVTIMVCEWVKTLSDPIIDMIIVHSRFLFGWLVKRFLAVFGLTSILCVIGMIFMRIALYEFSLIKLFLVFFGTTFFLSSLGVLSSFFSRQNHISTSVCGTFVLFSLIVHDLVRIPFIAHVYPFILFIDNITTIWSLNKAILICLGFIMWFFIYIRCHRRNFKM